MALPHVMVHADAGTSASINSNANDHPTQDSLPHGPSGSNLTSAEARPFNSNEFGAIMRLRKRLDLVDEHAQEIRAAQRALLKEEQSLARERDEILRCLSSIGVTVLTTTALYTDDSSRLITPDDNENSPIERTEFEPPKRKHLSADRLIVRKRTNNPKDQATNQNTSKPTPLTDLQTESTLMMECPPHLLQPSISLTRPPSCSPPPSFLNISAAPSSSGSVSWNGIRFPPGSAPRLHRARSSSPFTQMLPPFVPLIPSTPTTFKTHASGPIVQAPGPAYLGSLGPPACTGTVATHNPLVSESQAEIALQNDSMNINSIRPSGSYSESIPIHLMLNSLLPDWSLASMDPERVPSPPIGAPYPQWPARPDSRAEREELEKVVDPKGRSSEVMHEKTVYDSDGPASRTRARTSGIGAIDKKGKDSV